MKENNPVSCAYSGGTAWESHPFPFSPAQWRLADTYFVKNITDPHLGVKREINLLYISSVDNISVENHNKFKRMRISPDGMNYV